MLSPPPGVERIGKGVAKGHGPQVFNFDKSYWSFSKSDPTYGVWMDGSVDAPPG